MALVLADRVQETTITSGTGSVTLAGAVAGFQSFAVVGNGNTCYYTIVDGTAWEVGIGTYSTSGPTLARTTVLSNSSGNTSPLTLSSASKPIFLTYPSEKSVNLDASGNVSALGTISSGTWQGSTVGVAYGGTGVTSSSGANSVVLRDANQNITVNRLSQSSTSVTASGGTTTLTAASTFSQILNGTGGQTFKLPDATTLTNTTTFEFNNNATGTLTITDNANAVVGTVASGGAAAIALLSNGTVGGTWDVHAYIPESVTWGTNSLVLGSTVITGGTWNGGTITPAYGGTGLTTFAGANNALYSTGASTLTAGTLPVLAGGTGSTTASGARTNLDVPSTTGSGASGTWGINISGNAATATTATNQSGGTVSATTGSFTGTSWSNTAGGDFIISNSNTVGSSATLRPTNSTSYSAGWSLYAGASGAAIGDGSVGLWNHTAQAARFYVTQAGVGYLAGNVILNAGNYNSYAPTLTGTGASGTWSINVTGSAGSAATLTNFTATTSGTGFNPDSPPTIDQIGYWAGGYTLYGYGDGGLYTSGYSGSWYHQISGDFRTGQIAVRGKNNGTWQSWYYIPTYNVSNGYSTGNLYAGAYYDANNTGYYVDPNGGSVLLNLSINGVIYNATGNTAFNPNNGNYVSVYDTTGRVAIYLGNATDPGNYYDNTTHYFRNRSASNQALLNDSQFTHYSSVRSPIFYDYDNTGYYGDFASTNWGVYSAGGGRFRNIQISDSSYTDTIQNVTSGGTIWLNYGHNGNVGLAYGGGYTTAYQSIRSPIFYDTDNTAYFVDPASTSSASFAGYMGLGGNSYNTNMFGTYGVSIYHTNYPSIGFSGSSGQNYIIYKNTPGNYLAVYNNSYGETALFYPSYAQFYGSIRSQIFYDTDNTSFYLDPYGSSVLNTIYQSGYYSRTAAGGGVLSGNYPSVETTATTGAIYTIGGSYYPTGSSLNTMYGVGYTYGSAIGWPAAWGFYTSASGSSNHFLDASNGIGYASSSYRAQIFYDLNNTGYYVDPNSASSLDTVYTNVLYSYGNVTAYYSSDIKFKENVRDIPNALETVENIGGKLFDWTDEYMEENGGEDAYFLHKEDFGVIAQDVQKAFPVAVRTRPDGSLAVDYEKLSALAFAAVAELSNRVKSLEARM